MDTKHVIFSYSFSRCLRKEHVLITLISIMNLKVPLNLVFPRYNFKNISLHHCFSTFLNLLIYL